MTMYLRISLILGWLALGIWSIGARAEVSQVSVVRGWGAQFLPIIVMEHDKLLEKHLRAIGLDDTRVRYAQAGSSDASAAMLLSHSVDFVAGGTSAFIILWARTRNTANEVKAVGAVSAMPQFLNTRNPNIKSLKDFTAKDRIAVPGAKVSTQAIVLEMGAAKTFGEANFAKLDPLTVTLSHPDAMRALIAGSSSGITSHFTAPPFQYEELEHPGIHTVFTSDEVLPPHASLILLWTTSTFRRDNPKTYDAFLAAYKDAVAEINQDKKAAAQAYIEVTKTKTQTVKDLLKIFNDPDIKYTVVPSGTTIYANFMDRVGIIKAKPSSWKDMFFPDIGNVPGS